MARYKIISSKTDTEPKKTNKRRIINQDIFKVAIFFAAVFFGMVFFLGYYLTFSASTVINNPYNKRSDQIKRAVIRGSILAEDGEVLAYTEKKDDDGEVRIYPYGSDFAHVVGFEAKGGLGIESSYNYYLLTSHENIFSKIFNELNGEKSMGDNMVTTLDLGMQLQMNNILGRNAGAIIAIDPSTCEIKGMVSHPGFDPNEISEIWDEIVSDEDSSVLLNRATQGTLTPGSTFKIFTLLEYYREKGSGVFDKTFECQGSILAGDAIISCPYGRVHGEQDVVSAFANSCNCAFTRMGMELDLKLFEAGNNSLLFNSELPIDIASKASSYTLPEGSSEFMVGQTVFGQGQTLVSPVHLAMVTCAIANEGLLMKPHLVSEITDYKGNTVKTFKPEEAARLLNADEAEFMKKCMRAVVTEGTGQILYYEGNYLAYGKTGTAETQGDNGENYDHSWFTGFAENDGKTLVVCAMIENMQEAGITGIYAAQQVFNYYFN
ncbi:MAG: penicillin-binding transpeptidase domain-containing protein [Lachnospiraceae bacterium]